MLYYYPTSHPLSFKRVHPQALWNPRKHRVTRTCVGQLYSKTTNTYMLYPLAGATNCLNLWPHQFLYGKCLKVLVPCLKSTETHLSHRKNRFGQKTRRSMNSALGPGAGSCRTPPPPRRLCYRPAVLIKYLDTLNSKFSDTDRPSCGAKHNRTVGGLLNGYTDLDSWLSNI